MSSSALNNHLVPLLFDSDQIIEATSQLPSLIAGRAQRVAALNRAVVVTAVSAWEAYVEELVRESLVALRPAAPPLGLWPALNATVRGQLGRFNNPNVENVRLLLSDALGLADIQVSWAWQNCTTPQAVQRLTAAMKLRHEIAHGVNPRPVVSTFYASRLPHFFDRLGRCTDRAVRDHLVAVLGITHPWPA